MPFALQIMNVLQAYFVLTESAALNQTAYLMEIKAFVRGKDAQVIKNALIQFSETVLMVIAIMGSVRPIRDAIVRLMDS